MNENREALISYAANVPEWQTALICQQLAALNKAAAVLTKTSAHTEYGFAESKLRPDRYGSVDALTRKDRNTDVLSQAASALGNAQAALEILSALSNTFQRDFSSSVAFARECSYRQLEELCTRHGYRRDT